MGLYVYSLFHLLPVSLRVWFICVCSECTGWGRGITKERELLEPIIIITFIHVTATPPAFTHTHSISGYLHLSSPRCKYILKSDRMMDKQADRFKKWSINLTFVKIVFSLQQCCTVTPVLVGVGLRVKRRFRVFNVGVLHSGPEEPASSVGIRRNAQPLTCPQPSIHVYTCLTLPHTILILSLTWWNLPLPV